MVIHPFGRYLFFSLSLSIFIYESKEGRRGDKTTLDIKGKLQLHNGFKSCNKRPESKDGRKGDVTQATKRRDRLLSHSLFGPKCTWYVSELDVVRHLEQKKKGDPEIEIKRRETYPISQSTVSLRYSGSFSSLIKGRRQPSCQQI